MLQILHLRIKCTLHLKLSKRKPYYMVDSDVMYRVHTLQYSLLHQLIYIVITVSFNQSTYSVNENDGPAQPVLVLSNPSSTEITVQVRSNDITATGK